MGNGWKVIWFERHKKFIRNGFEGDKPSTSGALDFAKGLQSRGLSDVHIISKRKAFAPPLNKRRGPHGLLWCPYCLRWREFVLKAIRFEKAGVVSPTNWRCPICNVTINDAYVRSYNQEMVTKLDARLQQKTPSEKLIKRRIALTRRR